LKGGGQGKNFIGKKKFATQSLGNPWRAQRGPRTGGKNSEQIERGREEASLGEYPPPGPSFEPEMTQGKLEGRNWGDFAKGTDFGRNRNGRG